MATATQLRKAQYYLEQFGYFQSETIERFGFSMSKAHTGPIFLRARLDSRTQQAINAFQNYVGLPTTGELDEATLAFMERKRCGFPDVGLFVLQGNKWQNNQVSYGWLEAPTSLAVSAARQALAQAFKVWSDVSGLVFSEVTGDQIADIVIRFTPASHGDSFDFDGPNGVLAHAFFPPPNGGMLAGDAHFDNTENWTVSGGGIDLVTVAAHEIGHALGLAHSTVQNSLMYPYYGGPHQFLNPDDVAGIQSLYGPRVVAPAPPVAPPPPPAPPVVYVAFSVVGSSVYHDTHWVRGIIERRYTSFAQARAAGKRPCLICRPGG